MRTRTIIRVIAAVAFATGSLVAPTSAIALDDREPGDKVLDEAAASSNDARLVAKQYGWEYESTLKYLDESRRFAPLAAGLAADFPESYASARFAERPGGVPVIRFVGQPPAEASARIEKSGLRIYVQTDAKYTESELQDRAGSVHKHLLASGYKQVVTATTTTDGVMATVYGTGDPRLPDELAEGVEVSQSREPVSRDEHTRGGARLLDDGVFECTSGFTVVNGSGTTGVATAAHCDGLNQYQQPSDGLIYSMTHQSQHNGFWGDFEWKTTPHLEPAEYYARAAELRAVNSVSGWLPVNTPSCVYGRASNNRACDQVYSNFVIAGATWNLMAMDNDNTIGGDSGGPWSWSTEADGIHKGDIFLGGAWRNMWSRASLMPWALGVSVQT